MANRTAYSDRLFQSDPDKYDNAIFKVFGKKTTLEAKGFFEIEKFLRAYFEEPELYLTSVGNEVDKATGFPILVFKYNIP